MLNFNVYNFGSEYKQESFRKTSASALLTMVKPLTCNAGELHSIPRSGRSPGEGNDNPLQYSCLENTMDRGDWQGTVHGVSRVRHDLATKPNH